MEAEIIIIYVLSDNLLKAMRIYEDVRTEMSNAEVMTVVLLPPVFSGDTLKMRLIFFMKTIIFRIC